MNTIENVILTRRSCRSYTQKHIEQQDLECILKAAIYAPSGHNRLSWQFTVVKEKQNIQRLEEAVRKALNKSERYNFYQPDVIVLVSNDRSNPNGLADTACAMENMFLMAHSLGIGSCWINQLKDICDEADVRAILKQFKVPDHHIVWGIADLGYVNQISPRPQRDEKAIVYVD